MFWICGYGWWIQITSGGVRHPEALVGNKCGPSIFRCLNCFQVTRWELFLCDDSVASCDWTWWDLANYSKSLSITAPFPEIEYVLSYNHTKSLHSIMSWSGRTHVEVFAQLLLSWVLWIGPYQNDELIMSNSCSWSLISNVALKVFEKNDLSALVSLKFIFAHFVNFDTIIQAVLKLIVSLCRSLNDMRSFQLIKPIIWKNAAQLLPSLQKKS